MLRRLHEDEKPGKPHDSRQVRVGKLYFSLGLKLVYREFLELSLGDTFRPQSQRSGGSVASGICTTGGPATFLVFVSGVLGETDKITEGVPTPLWPYYRLRIPRSAAVHITNG